MYNLYSTYHVQLHIVEVQLTEITLQETLLILLILV
jgi:hypothetical protein